MLEFRNLSLAYGQHIVLQECNLTVTPGEVLALIGPNGAGKTTLLNAASGTLPPISGNIFIDQEKLSELSPKQRARLMAVVPQSRLLPPTFSVRHTVLLGRTPHLGWLGKSSPEDSAKVQSALERVQLDQFADRPIGELSGGEQQRVLLARALAQDTPILLLDEPTAHLDIRFQASFLNLVRDLAKDQGLAVLMALHDLNLAAVNADRIALLAESRLQKLGTPREVLTSEILSAAYTVPVEVIPHPDNGHPLVLLPQNSIP